MALSMNLKIGNCNEQTGRRRDAPWYESDPAAFKLHDRKILPVVRSLLKLSCEPRILQPGIKVNE